MLLASVAQADGPGVVLQGELRPGAILIGSTEADASVSFRGEDVMVGPDGRFVIGLPRDASGEARLRVTGADGQVTEQRLPLSQREYEVTVVKGVPQKTVEPSRSDLDRIRTEQRVIDAARERRDPTAHFAAGWRWPAVGRQSGAYGTARRYNEDSRLRIHWGVDVAQPIGTPVHAPAPGVVTLAEPDLFYSGGTVFIDHGHGMVSSFLHMSALHVEVGDEVEPGDLIGEIGMSGRATGPHLDWRIRLRGTWVDPQSLVGAMPDPDQSLSSEAGSKD